MAQNGCKIIKLKYKKLEAEDIHFCVILQLQKAAFFKYQLYENRIKATENNYLRRSQQLTRIDSLRNTKNRNMMSVDINAKEV